MDLARNILRWPQVIISCSVSISENLSDTRQANWLQFVGFCSKVFYFRNLKFKEKWIDTIPDCREKKIKIAPSSGPYTILNAINFKSHTNHYYSSLWWGTATVDRTLYSIDSFHTHDDVIWYVDWPLSRSFTFIRANRAPKQNVKVETYKWQQTTNSRQHECWTVFACKWQPP